MKANIIDTAIGNTLCDIVIKNTNVVDLFSGKIIKGDVGIYKDIIVGVGEYSGKKEIDGSGKFVMPGFIDTHVHIESAMVSPAEYARAVMPMGVTTVIADPHEIANVCGEKGLSYMKKSAENVPLDILYMLPSCVPATGFEDSGAVINSDDVKRLISGFNGLGELMNSVGVLNKDSEVLEKMIDGVHIDGHAPFLSGNELNAYIAAGVSTDHECTTGEELEERVSKGMYVQIREGTLSKDLDKLLPYVTPRNSRRCIFCTDDRYIGDIKKSGSINYCIEKAYKSGTDIYDAIAMASINAAECYGIKKRGAILPGYFADIVISEDICPSDIYMVIKNGQIVSENKKAVFESEKCDISDVCETVHTDKLSAEFFEYSPKEKFYAVTLNKNTIITTKTEVNSPDGLNKVCVIERHHNTGKKAIGFVTNYGIKNGAAASTIGHDSHNIIVIGDNDEDMALAVNTLGKNGGICVVSGGKVLEYMELEIAGLMSDKSCEEVIDMHEKLDKAIESLGVDMELKPFIAMAFLPLPVIPEIRITDRGVFDVTEFRFIEQ